MLGIFREEIFSPNRVEDDAAILTLTANALRNAGYYVQLRKPHEISAALHPTVTFAMCEGIRPLRILERWQALGYLVTNNPIAVQNCYRWRMLSILNGANIPIPKTLVIRTSEQVNGQFDYGKGVWVKRGDVHSTHDGDVRLIYDRQSLERTLEEFRIRWIRQAILQEHIEGDLIKFYGVRGQGWFRYLYHKPDKVVGYPFSFAAIKSTAERTAARLGLDVFGGDIVVTENGHYLIDINSWPSFAPCREEASEQIASFIIDRIRALQPSTSMRWGSV